ncbi:MAG: PPC domain-containing DNA-binding protein [Candidatus Rokuibacteriota bacterium]
MKSKALGDDGERTNVLVFETGDRVMDGLLSFAKARGLTAGHFTGLGAFGGVTLGYFDWETKDYSRIEIRDQVEVLSLVGDIALENDAPKVHAHVVVGKADGTAHGGHLIEAHVRPTLEVILAEPPGHLRRQFDRDSGLALIRL